MTRKELPKPFFPLKHEFIASLDNYIEKVTMLYGIARFIAQHCDELQPALREKLKTALDDFDKARSED